MFLLFREIAGEAPFSLALAPEEMRHARARRLADGAAVHLGDGRGRRWAGTLNGATWLRAVDQAAETRHEPEIVLCTALPEGRRWDWLIQKAVELGVTFIQPVNFRRSVRREINVERGQAVVVEAATQARRFVLPALAAPIAGADLDARLARCETSYLLATEAPFDRAGSAGRTGGRAAVEGVPVFPAAIIVGPEGGFEMGELDRLRALPNLREVRLGRAILRIETAGLAMLARLLPAEINSSENTE